MSEYRSILVHAPSWVGDGVMSLAALRSLKAAYPRARLSVLSRSGAAELFEGCEAADETLVYDARGRHRGTRGFWQAAQELKKKEFDLAVLFPNAFRSASLAWAARIPERFGYATDGRGFLLTRAVPPAPRPFGRHQVHYYLDLLRALGVPSGPVDIHLELTEGMRAAAVSALVAAGWEMGAPLIGLHPGSTGSSAKRWLPERYAAVGSRLARRHAAQIVVLGGAGEEELGAQIASELKLPSILLSGKTSLGALMGTLSFLTLLVTNDSGPMHLASALDVPTVAVFGPTDERETGPLSVRARVVRRHVDCSPCLLRRCPIDHRCMTWLGVDEVCSAATELLPQAPEMRRARAASP